MTLLEILEPESASRTDRDFEVRVQSALAPVVRALLAPAPGARPSASWVFRRALAAAANAANARAKRTTRTPRCVAAPVCGEATFRRAGTRSSPLRAAKARASSFDGPAADWVAECRALAEGILKLRGRSLDDVLLPPIAPLDELSRARFLVALVGPAAASWPALRDLREEQLLARLLDLAELREPESFTLAAIEHGAVPELPSAAAEVSAVDVALALGRALPDPAWLDSGESLVNREGGPLQLGLGAGSCISPARRARSRAVVFEWLFAGRCQGGERRAVSSCQRQRVRQRALGCARAEPARSRAARARRRDPRAHRARRRRCERGGASCSSRSRTVRTAWKCARCSN